MNRFIKWLIDSARGLLADMLGQIIAFFMFIAAGLAWLYFATDYAVIPVFIVGVVLGGYIYGLVEGKKGENTETKQD